MGSFQSFAQELEKRIRKEIEKEFLQPEPSSPSEVKDFPSETWTHLVGQVGTFRFQADPRAAAYHRTRPAPKPRPAHNLNEIQSKAWTFFQSHLEIPLEPNFSQSQLKAAFRALALRLHPDQGGSHQRMQELLWARRQLETVFQK